MDARYECLELGRSEGWTIAQCIFRHIDRMLINQPF